MDFELNEEQQHALDVMLSGQNTFLTGKAGTGKTVVINEFTKHFKGKLIKLAPTGLAARNLGDATTIHSGLGIDIGFHAITWEPIYNPKQEALCRNIDTILIDEISMVRADLFTAIDNQMRFYAQDEDKHLPFGGKQIIVVGDFYQLAPILVDELQEFFSTQYKSCYAFKTLSWEQAKFTNIFLAQIQRQRDKYSIDTLDNLRNNMPEIDFCINVTCYKRFNFKNLKEDPNSMCICCYSQDAEDINNLVVNKIQDLTGFTNSGYISGIFPRYDLPTNYNLTLKIGERVMCLANHKSIDNSDEFEYVNGDVGIIIGYDQIKGTVSVKLLNGKIITVARKQWINYAYEVKTDEDGEKTIAMIEIGSFSQIPLTPAYAITIHKSQGKTLEKAHLVLGKGCFAYGQVYTALSRVRSLRNLTMDRPINCIEVMNNLEVIDFYNRVFKLSNNEFELVI